MGYSWMPFSWLDGSPLKSVWWVWPEAVLSSGLFAEGLWEVEQKCMWLLGMAGCAHWGGGFSGFAMAVSCFFLLFLFAFLPSAWRRLKGLLWNPAVLMNCIKPGKAKEPFQRKQKCMCRPIFAYLGLQKAGLCRVVFSSSNKRLYPNCTDLFTMLDLVTLPTDFYNSSNSFIGVRRFV